MSFSHHPKNVLGVGQGILGACGAPVAAILPHKRWAEFSCATEQVVVSSYSTGTRLGNTEVSAVVSSSPVLKISDFDNE